MSRLKLVAIVDRLSQSLWAIPALGLLIAIVLSEIIPRVWSDADGELLGILLTGVGAGSARAMLSTIAGAAITLTALVFTMTMLLLQLASSQLSPRVMRTFLADRGNQVVLALFIGTFAYSLLALRGVRAGGDESVVPSLTVWVAFVLALLSVGGFVYYTDHVAQTIRPVNVIARVADETLAAIDRLYPDEFGEAAAEPPLPAGPPDHVIASPHRGGVIVGVDPDGLMRLAAEHSCVVELSTRVGDFIAHGGVLFRVWGALPPDVRDGLPDAVFIAHERTMRQDAAFGFRQLVDIAERALSPGINDPTTAVQVIDRLHDLLRRIAGRSIPSPYRVDADGALLLILPRPDWEDYVALTLDELRIYGRGSLQVTRRLHQLLEDIASAAPPPRRVVLGRQISLLEAGTVSGFDLEHDRATASASGRQGLGA